MIPTEMSTIMFWPQGNHGNELCTLYDVFPKWYRNSEWAVLVSANPSNCETG